MTATLAHSEFQPPSALPADSPYATGVGGVSLALTSTNAIAWQAGWGTDETLLNDEGTLFDPPLAFGFNFGTGGGREWLLLETVVPVRIAWVPLACCLISPGSPIPLPGPLSSLSNQGETPTWYAYGGTSLATPMFSGLWALANEEAGVPLGQAAAYVYSLPSEAIFDIVPLGSTHNVTATIKESSTVTNTYTASEVMGGATPAKFYTGLWNVNYFSDLVYAISFGTDCSLLPSTDNDGTSCNTPQALQTDCGLGRRNRSRNPEWANLCRRVQVREVNISCVIDLHRVRAVEFFILRMTSEVRSDVRHEVCSHCAFDWSLISDKYDIGAVPQCRRQTAARSWR